MGTIIVTVDALTTRSGLIHPRRIIHLKYKMTAQNGTVRLLVIVVNYTQRRIIRVDESPT